MTREEFLERVSYCQTTGVFRARKSSGKRKAGATLGYVRTDGYAMLFLKGKWFYAHRLALFLSTGAWPAQEVDHINGIRSDNRLNNLRPCSRSQNMYNTMKKGVCYHKTQLKWVASIRVNTKRLHLGSFTSEADALAAYDAAARKYHGSFMFIAPSAPMRQEAMDL